MGGKTKHGDSRIRLYKEWQSMRYRCQNKNHTAYKKYGAKGIKVCLAWDRSYPAFKKWSIENGYNDLLTIDRKNSRRGYSPSNCRWVGYDVQNNHLCMLKTNTSGYKGVSWNKKRKCWRCNISIKNKTVWIGDYSTIKEAINARNNFICSNNLLHEKVKFRGKT